jgi:hypothetical protein
MFCETTESSDASLGRMTRFFLFIALLVLGGFVLASLPELKRYIKISSM